MNFRFGQQELLKSHGLTESESGAPSDGDRGQRRERRTERKKLHQLKRDHERQEGTKRKVLRMNEGQEDGFSSGSDSEQAGRSKKRKQEPGQDVDIQVKSIDTLVIVNTRFLSFLKRIQSKNMTQYNNDNNNITILSLSLPVRNRR